MQATQKNKTKLQEYRDTMLIYLKHWHWFVIGLAASLLGVWIYVRLTTPVYRINSTVTIYDDKKGDGILKATAFSDLNMFQETKTTDNEIEVLRSRDLIYKALVGLKQEVSFFKKDGWHNKELYGNNIPYAIAIHRLTPNAYRKVFRIKPYTNGQFILFEGDKSWIYNYGQLIQHQNYAFAVSKQPYADSISNCTFKFNNLSKMATAYSLGRLQIDPVIKESNTVILTVNDPLPERGMAFLSLLVNLYNEENVNKKNAIAINNIALIDNQLKLLGNQLTAVDSTVEVFKKANSMAVAGNGVNLTKSAEYDQMTAESDMQLSQIKAIENYLNDPQNLFKVIPSTMGLKDVALNELVTRFNDLQIQRDNMLNNADASNPLVQNLSNQLSALLSHIKENLKNIKQGVIIQRNNLKSNSYVYDERLKSEPTVERGILERNREQGIKATLYQYLLQKREEIALALSANVPAAQVVDQPSYTGVPVFPKTSLLFMLCGFLGLATPGMMIWGRQKLNMKVTNASSLEQIADVKVLGELCHYTQKDPVVVRAGGNTIISELFRYIRTHLNMIDTGNNNKVILVTSCTKGEGKTFFCINLALTLGLQRKKVLVMEFDLRKPDLLKKLKIEQDKGITDFLQDENIALPKYIQPVDDMDNVDVLGCGSLSDYAAELITSGRVTSLFDWLKRQYDYIIVDTSPVGEVADTFSLAQYADISLYLIRYNYSNTEQLGILKDINDHGKFKNLMVVFNDAKKENRNGYAYGSYGYAAERR